MQCSRRSSLWPQAKADAAAAKASGNQAQQKVCGQLIGQLRQEMRALGISDAELEETAVPAGPAPQPAAAGGSAADAEEAGEEQQQERAVAAGFAPSPPAVSQSEAAVGSDSEEEGGRLGFDLFGDSSAVDGAEVVKSKLSRAEKLAAAAAKAAAAAAAAAAQTGGGGGKKKGKQPAAPKVEAQQPKALLQQHCQRAGWAAPRFERLPHGGMRLEVGAGLAVSAHCMVDTLPRCLPGLRKDRWRCLEMLPLNAMHRSWFNASAGRRLPLLGCGGAGGRQGP